MRHKPALQTASLAAIAATLMATLIAPLAASPARADAIAECKAFFQKFETCAAGLKGDQQEEARIFMKTLRGTVGMSDDLNQGDPMLTGVMCGFMMEEAKKDPMVQKYNCAW